MYKWKAKVENSPRTESKQSEMSKKELHFTNEKVKFSFIKWYSAPRPLHKFQKKWGNSSSSTENSLTGKEKKSV